MPISALKSLPIFIGEDQTSTIEHIRDVAFLCALHNITQDNVAVRLLVASLKGKALQWFRCLAIGSITNWDGLG